MIQEQIYIKLLKGEWSAPASIPKEFLRDFQFCKIALEKHRLDLFSEEQQRKMNLLAVEHYFNCHVDLCLRYNIPEITSLLPRKILGYLSLWSSENLDLPQLEFVGENLSLGFSKVTKIVSLKSVGGMLDLGNSSVRELPQLRAIRDFLNLQNSQIRELPSLEAVFEIVVERERVGYWKDYFTKTNRPHLAEKVFGA